MESDDLLAVKKRKVETEEALKEIKTKKTDTLGNLQIVKKRKLENPNGIDNEEYCAITKPEENGPVASSKYSLQNCTTNALSQIDSLLDKINDQQTDATQDSNANSNQDMTDTIMKETLEEEDKNKKSGTNALLVIDSLLDKTYDQQKDATNETHVNVNQNITNKTMIEETVKKEDKNKNREINALSIIGGVLNTIYDQQKDATTDSLINKNKDIIDKTMIKKTVEKKEENKNRDINALSAIDSLLDKIDQQKDAAIESQVNKNENITGKTIEETMEQEDKNKIIANDFPVEHYSNATHTSTDIINLDSSDDEEITEEISPVLGQLFQNTTEVQTILAPLSDIIDLTNNSFNDEQSNESYPESNNFHNLSIEENPPVNNLMFIDLTDYDEDEEENNELVSEDGSQSDNSDGKHNDTQNYIPVNTNIIEPRKDNNKSVNIKLYKSSSSKNTWLTSRQSNEDIEILQISSDSSSSIAENIDDNLESENNDDDNSQVSLNSPQDTNEKDNDAEAYNESDVTDYDNDNQNETDSQSGTMDNNVNNDPELENNANDSSKSFNDSDSNNTMDNNVSDDDDDVESPHSDNNIEDSFGYVNHDLPNDDINNSEFEDSDLDSVVNETLDKAKSEEHYDSSDNENESMFDEDLDGDSSSDNGTKSSVNKKYLLKTNSSESFESSSDANCDSDDLHKDDEKKADDNLKLQKGIHNNSDDYSGKEELSTGEEFDPLYIQQVDSDSDNTTDINENDDTESQNNDDKIEILHKDNSEPDSELKTDDELIETSQANSQRTLKNNLNNNTNMHNTSEFNSVETEPGSSFQTSGIARNIIDNVVTEQQAGSSRGPHIEDWIPEDYEKNLTVGTSKDTNYDQDKEVFPDTDEFKPVYGVYCSLTNCIYSENDCMPECYYRFPSDIVKCHAWIEQCGSRNLPFLDLQKLHECLYLCSLHFEEEMFLSFENKVLYANAIPTIFRMKTTFEPKKSFTIHTKITKIKMIFDSLYSSTSSPTGFPEDIKFQKLVSEAISQNENVNKSVILLQERFKYIDTIEKCIQVCEDLLPPDFLKLVKDYLLDN